MAKFNRNEGGLTFKFEPPPKKKKSVYKGPTIKKCEACDFETPTRTKQGHAIEDHGLCLGCINFFGALTHGVTNLDHTTVKERLEKVKEAKHVIILKSGSFVDGTSGDSLGVDFGDIFPVNRVGSENKPTGKWQDAMERFTIDIMINDRPLKLLPHEFAEIAWVTIMIYRKDGDYTEAYLSDKDKTGYFAPSKEVREMITNAFGDR